ncbi:PTS fructose transporter subunit IIA [Planctomycetales bacterium]|nr:PTS fructose transporter subunit IIA [Planctomycetales bacterium]GHV18789.1 PTS fructose transporter subunit IIA [Planctomycetales bacterium]
MLLRDFISPTTIIGNLDSTTRDEALAEILDDLIAREVIHKSIRNGLLEALIQREEIASTAVGNGVAVPHAKHPAITRLTGVVARCREGAIFRSPHPKPEARVIPNPHADEPVYVIVMIFSNQQLIAQHLAALGYVGKLFVKPEIAGLIRNAHDEKDIWNIFLENDSAND